jgi:hypothetical protein
LKSILGGAKPAGEKLLLLDPLYPVHRSPDGMEELLEGAPPFHQLDSPQHKNPPALKLFILQSKLH